MRKCIKENGIPLTSSEKNKRYRDKKRQEIIYMKKIISEIENSRKPKSPLIHDSLQTDIEDFTRC